MDKETRNYLEILMSQVDALGVRIRKLEDRELVIKVVHVRDDGSRN